MAFMPDDDSSSGLLAALLAAGGSGGGLGSGGGGLLGKLLGGRSGGLLEGPTPTQAYTETIQSSPFYQGVPSQSGPFGQIAQALMPLIQATQAEQQARETGKIRKQLIGAEVQKAEAQQRQAALEQFFLANPEAANALAARLGPGVKQKVGSMTFTGQEPPPPPLPSVAEQAANAPPGSLISTKYDPDAGGLVVSTRQPSPDSIGKRVAELTHVLAGQGASEADIKAIEQRGKIVDKGLYPTADGQWVPAPRAEERDTAYNGIRLGQNLKQTLGKLQTIVAKHPHAAGGGLLGALANVKNSAIDGLVSLDPALPGYLQSRMAAIRQDARQNPEDERLQQMVGQFKEDLSVAGTLRTILSYEFARFYEPTGRLSDPDIDRWLKPLQGNSGFLAGWLGGGLGADASLREMQSTIDNRLGVYKDVNRRTQESMNWVQYGDQALTPSPVPDPPSAIANEIPKMDAYKLYFDMRKKQMPNASDSEIDRWVAKKLYEIGYRKGSSK